MRKNTVRPTDIKLHQKSRILEVVFTDGSRFEFPAEYLRVYSPSAEVRGHGPGQEVLQVGKGSVNIVGVDPVGTYAVLLRFDDGHDTGIYSWDLLHNLGLNQEALWNEYLNRLEQAGHGRA
ncbi:MAG: gamma-butyrobetaine hydroxylase family protein [Acidiferrobacter sp.]